MCAGHRMLRLKSTLHYGNNLIEQPGIGRSKIARKVLDFRRADVEGLKKEGQVSPRKEVKERKFDDKSRKMCKER
ncbi:hypothetical protein E2C01_095822 [Portunus trituberculatus]|uniref:Uncharacterized protein n=1 Tax=Portunus trituberculatus TaxID=210409 RepID=A0A5B7K0E8_PORTR|nr:hypothetical protein [Portunus trituberculatus]